MRPSPLLLSVALVLVAGGCSPTRLALQSTAQVPRQVPPVVVVLEPFFENTRARTVTRTETASINGGTMNPAGSMFGGGSAGPAQVTFQRTAQEKPPYATPAALAAGYQQVLAEVQRLRPDWRVVTTGTLPVLEGPVVLVRTVVGEAEVVQTNRPLKTVAAVFGFLLVPLVYAVPPVEETQRVAGALYAYEGDAQQLRQRMLRYPTQPDFAVDTRGLTPRVQPYGLDVPYQEGLLAGEGGRPPVLVEGLARQLAVAVVAMVEGVR